MSVPKLHDDQLEISSDLVRRLLRAQFPQWADLPLKRFPSGGTVNAIYRLGDDMYVRLPLVEKWAAGIKRETKWLERMRPHVPFEIPEQLAQGEPGEGYPVGWAVYRWIDGELWSVDHLRDEVEGAHDLAQFITSLQRVDATGIEPLRISLEPFDAWVRESIEKARDLLDADAVTAAWDIALNLPAFDGPDAWVHSDLGPDNVLIREGRLHAVIDWSEAHFGDPAVDYSVAWGPMFSSRGRAAFRDALSIDDETWARARAWATRAVEGVNYYRDSNPTMFENCFRRLQDVLDDLAAE